MPSRSPLKLRMMPMKPPFSGPIRLAAGTRTSSKWIAAVSLTAPAHLVEPGALTPRRVHIDQQQRDAAAPGPPVRTAQVSQSARMPDVMNILPPLTMYSSPSLTAVVLRFATSLPPDGFGDAERDDLVARQHRRRDALLQLFRAERKDRRQADAVRHQRRAEAPGADRRQFLGQHQPVEIVEAFAVPAIFFGIAQPEDARLGSLFMQVARQFALGLPAVDMGRDLARDEPADALRQRLMSFVIIGRTRAPVVECCHGGQAVR